MTGPISFPGIFLRRLVNVISTLSLSHQYFHLKQGRTEDKPEEKRPQWSYFSSLKVPEWRWMLWNSAGVNSPLNPSSTNSPLWPPSPTLSMSDPSLHETGSDSLGHIPELPANRPKLHQPPKPPPPEPRRPEVERDISELDPIHQLLLHPALFDPLRTPRYPIVLSHGLYGYDARGPTSFPSLRMQYWSNVLNILRNKVHAEVIITSVPGTGSIVSRAEALDRHLQLKACGRGINFLAHSMGGLDCRHLISHIKPTEYVPLSLTTIGTPHRGSPFMDWCAENIGLGKLKREEFISRSAATTRLVDANLSPATADLPPESASAKPKDASFSLSQLPSSFATFILSIVDSPAYANLTSSYLNDVFNPRTPDDPRVRYFSVAGRMPGVNIWHPLWLPKTVLDGVEEKERDRLRTLWENDGRTEADPLWRRSREWGNDGLVTVQSAKWGEFLGIIEGSDHWELRGARGIEFGVDLPSLPAIGLGGPINPGGDGWGIDWGRFVRVWKKEETTQHNPGHSQPATSREEELKNNADDALIRNSTEKLASAFDWLVEQVPVAPKLVSEGKIDGKVRTEEEVAQMQRDEKHMKEEGKETRKKSELAKKEDLERFYVALSRKMYDEGL